MSRRQRVCSASLCGVLLLAGPAAVSGAAPGDPTGPLDRLRAPRAVDTGAGQAATPRPAPPGPALAEGRPIEWWPHALRPPFDAIAAARAHAEGAIHAGNAAFLLGEGPPAIPPELRDPRPLAEGAGYYIVHLRAPLSAPEEAELARAGLPPVAFLPPRAYLVRVPAGALERLAHHPRVDGLFRYEPAFKISPQIGRLALSAAEVARRGPGRVDLRVVVFAGEDPGRVADQAAAWGAQTLWSSAPEPIDPGLLPDGRARARRAAQVRLRVAAAALAELVPRLARLDAVRWIEEVAEYRFASDWTVSGWDYGDSRSAGSDFLTVRQPWNNGLHGEGILLGNVDSGADLDHGFLAAPAEPGAAPESPPTQACPGDGPKNTWKFPYYHLGPPSGGITPVCYDQSSSSPNPDLFGHGTATTGLFAADATASDGSAIDIGSGTAPESQVWLYDVGSASGNDLAIDPGALSMELRRMADAGAVAVNLSFVDPEADGGYDFLSELLDEATWDTRSLLPVQAVGNDGANSGGGSVGSVDSTGKNVLSVGGNMDDVPNNLYANSSRGPTTDGRYKPDVISPAMNPLGTPHADPELDQTLLLLQSDGVIDSGNSGRMYGAQGTSLSCASVTGLAGVVAQYFREGFYPTGAGVPADAIAPTADLLKAVLINSARRMTGSGVLDDARPGKDQGWGRVELNAPLYFSADPSTGDDPRRLVVYRGEFAQGAHTCPADSEIFTVQVFNEEEPLRITLAWTDYPGNHSSPAATQLVNDLDLIVTAPGGTVYRGNGFDETGSGLSLPGGDADRANPVENVWLAEGPGLPTGLWTIEVCPHAVGQGVLQPFALVVTGGVEAGKKVRLDQSGYTCADTIGVEVEDVTASGPTVAVQLTSATTGDSETLTLSAAEPTATFRGTLATAAGAATPGNGVLEVQDGGTIQAAYGASTARAAIDCTPAVCYAVDLGPLLRHECDHDGFGDNGEELHLDVPLRNAAAFPVDGTHATLTSNNGHVVVSSGTAHYGTLEAGAVAYPDSDGTDDPFVLSVSGAACDEQVTLTLTVVAGNGWSAAGCGSGSIPLRLERDPYPLQTYDFDDGSAQGFTHVMAHGTRPAEECSSSYQDVWQTFPTQARAHSGAYSMRLGTGSYPTLTDAALVSPPLSIPTGGARLRFRYWMDADIYDGAQVWHGFLVEARPTSGGTWQRITPLGGYNALAARRDCKYFFPFANTGTWYLPLFGGDGGGSVYAGDTFDVEHVLDLASWAGTTVQVRFRFGSDDYVSGAEGLYIDSLVLEGFQCETPNVCDDGEVCTTESCEPDAGGCQYTPAADHAPCDDGEACTAGEECLAGVCQGTEAIACDDGNACTDDWAEDDGDGTCDDPATDCRHQNNVLPCSDGNACTTEDRCSAGSCVAGPALVCNDLNVCTNDSCTPSTGCVFSNNSKTCDDLRSCTTGDVCSGGTCSGTPNHAACDDANACTENLCNPAAPGAGADGCAYPALPNGSPCDDASVCTITQSCQGGSCSGTELLDCSDGAACTEDGCDPVAGCRNPEIDLDGDAYGICGSGDPVNPDGREADCQDGNPDVHPEQPEDCYNGVDEDCDDLIDEADAEGCPRSDVTGTISYYRTAAGTEPGTHPVAGASLSMVGSASGTATSDGSGYYAHLDILKGAVSVIPAKLGDFDNGISSLDASRVSQYRVGLITLTARQLIAADTSGNGTISSYDASLISQFRVGIITRFPVAIAKGSDWAFEPTQRDYAPLDADRHGENYLAILYGDVTGNWAPSGALLAAAPGPAAASAAKSGEAAGACVLSLEPAAGLAPRRGTLFLDLVATGCHGLLALDLDLGYPPGALELASAATTEATREFTLTTHEAQGLVRLSLFGATPLVGDGKIVRLAVALHAAADGAGITATAVANEGGIHTAIRVPAVLVAPVRGGLE